MDSKRITVNANIMQGRPCIRGMRIAVDLIVNLVANGMATEEILRNYPDLEPADVEACLHYAACLRDPELRT
jgi:uncharacterized protein (DUF433 family)